PAAGATLRGRWPAHHSHELDQCLVGDDEGVLLDAFAQQLRRTRLLRGKARVEAVHQDIGINQTDHVSTVLPDSSHAFAPSRVAARAGGCVDVPWRDRTRAIDGSGPGSCEAR